MTTFTFRSVSGKKETLSKPFFASAGYKFTLRLYIS